MASTLAASGPSRAERAAYDETDNTTGVASCTKSGYFARSTHWGVAKW